MMNLLSLPAVACSRWPCASRSGHHRAMRSGFSLLEAVVATLLVGLLVVGSLRSLGAALQTHAVVQQEIRATMLAEQLLTEISAMPWFDPDGVASARTIGRDLNDPLQPTARAQLDDMDDFHLWTETPPTTVTGVPLPGGDRLTRQVSIFNLSAADARTRVAADVNTGLREIVVTVLQGYAVRARVSQILVQADQTLTSDLYQHPTIP